MVSMQTPRTTSDFLVIGAGIAGASVAYFPAPLKPLNGKTVKLQGYLLPLEAGQAHRRFLLSAWSPSCPFCLTAGPEAMIEVKARKDVKASLDPIVVQGRFELLDNDPAGMFFRLVDAEPATL